MWSTSEEGGRRIGEVLSVFQLSQRQQLMTSAIDCKDVNGLTDYCDNDRDRSRHGPHDPDTEENNGIRLAAQLIFQHEQERQ
jgi:hypothetical protein